MKIIMPYIYINIFCQSCMDNLKGINKTTKFTYIIGCFLYNDLSIYRKFGVYMLSPGIQAPANVFELDGLGFDVVLEFLDSNL